MDLPFSRNFRRRHPKFSRFLGIALVFAIAFVVGLLYASWALVCRAGACPSVDEIGRASCRERVCMLV